MNTVTLSLTIEQAHAVKDALDLYTRVCIGQIEELASMARFEVIPSATRFDKERRALTPVDCEAFEDCLKAAKSVLGHPANGSFGIGSPHVHVSGKRTYEVYKVISKALANAREPNPSFKGVDYDGILVRYTTDPEPKAVVSAA